MFAYLSVRRPGAVWIDAALVAAGAAFLMASAAGPARAASSFVDAMVVPGYAPAAAPAAAAPVRRSGYGGGFLELLVNAGSPSPMPTSVLYGRAPARAAPAAYSAVAYAPPAPPQGMYAAEPRPSVDPAFQRTEVPDPTGHAPGTIVVDTGSKFLYLVESGGRATRYGIGVGRPGFAWSGVKTVTRKAEWPDWTPPAEMLLRRPDLPRHMAGGPENPLGARALYLGSSLYRIHGTNEPYTIGRNVSSGCIRMMNDDVVDLYGRVNVGAKVVVM